MTKGIEVRVGRFDDQREKTDVVDCSEMMETLDDIYLFLDAIGLQPLAAKKVNAIQVAFDDGTYMECWNE